jgi:hypothetical protein
MIATPLCLSQLMIQSKKLITNQQSQDIMVIGMFIKLITPIFPKPQKRFVQMLGI